MPRTLATERVERYSHGQLFSACVLFLLGTTWLFIPGAAMGRDSWIASLMGMAAGLLLTLLYLRLHALFPNETMVQWLIRLCGPFLGYALAVIYVIYFLYCSARNLRDVAELLHLSFLSRTPILILTLLQSTLVALSAYYGLEVTGRLKQLLLPVALFFLVIVGIGLWFRRYPLHLYPILEYGLFPVWHYTFPTIVTVPYGELVVYLMLLPYLRGSPTKPMVASILSGGLILTLIAFLATLVIGPANLANATLPFYTMVRSVAFGDVLQRLDAIIVPMLAFCAYAKAASYMLGASYGAAHLLGAKRPATLALPMGVAGAAWATTMAASWGQHLDIGLRIVPYALHIPLQFLVPLLLWLLAEARSRFRPIQRPIQIFTQDKPPRWSLITATILAMLLWVPSIFPTILERSPLTEMVLKPLVHWVGEPVVRLLGGAPMKE